MHPMACPSYPALSAMEEQLIALVLPVVKIVRLRGGQLGYTGSCVAVRQDITRGAHAMVAKDSLVERSAVLV